MKISIAMATYNGAKYIREQLDSFTRQTCLPHELVICDDNSSDYTVEICEEFSSKALFNVKIFKNKENLGLLKNFEKAITKCTGDIIFLSDQDDVWYPNKIETILDKFKEDSNYSLVVHDMDIADSFLRKSGYTKMFQSKSRKINGVGSISGCCTVIKADFLRMAVPFPEIYNAHDVWLHKLASILNVRKEIKEVLQVYRRHDKNASSGDTSSLDKVSWAKVWLKLFRKNPSNTIPKQLEKVELIKDRLNNLKREGFNHNVDEALLKICDEIDSVKMRYKILLMPRILRLPYALKLLRKGGYCYFKGEWKSFIKDLILPKTE